MANISLVQVSELKIEVAANLREDAARAGITLDPFRPESDPLTEEQWITYVKWLDSPRSARFD